jgi:hypothetical protein
MAAHFLKLCILIPGKFREISVSELGVFPGSGPQRVPPCFLFEGPNLDLLFYVTAEVVVPMTAVRERSEAMRMDQ